MVYQLIKNEPEFEIISLTPEILDEVMHSKFQCRHRCQSNSGRGMKKIFLLRKSLLAGILEEEARENSYNLKFVIDR